MTKEQEMYYEQGVEDTLRNIVLRLVSDGAPIEDMAMITGIDKAGIIEFLREEEKTLSYKLQKIKTILKEYEHARQPKSQAELNLNNIFTQPYAYRIMDLYSKGLTVDAIYKATGFNVSLIESIIRNK